MSFRRAVWSALGELSGPLTTLSILWAVGVFIYGAFSAAATKSSANATVADYGVVGGVTLLLLLLPFVGWAVVSAARRSPLDILNPHLAAEDFEATTTIGTDGLRHESRLKLRALKDVEVVYLHTRLTGQGVLHTELLSEGRLLGPTERQGAHYFEVRKEIAKGDWYELRLLKIVEDPEHTMSPFIGTTFDAYAKPAKTVRLVLEFDGGVPLPSEVFGWVYGTISRRPLEPATLIHRDGRQYAWEPKARRGCRYTMSWVY